MLPRFVQPIAVEPRAERPVPRPHSVLERGLPAWAVIGVGLAALLTLLAQHGFHLGEDAARWLEIADYSIAGVFALDLLICLARTDARRELVRRRWFEFLLLALLLLSLTFFTEMRPGHSLEERGTAWGVSVPKLYLAAVQVFLLATIVARTLRAQERLLERPIRPEFVLIGSFAILVLGGASMLLLPRARPVGVEAWSPIDALFTATSAACVTGLAVRDTGSELSRLGQWILLAVIQLGGLGIVTFVVAGQIFSARRLSVPQMVLLKEVLSTGHLADVRRHVRAVVLVALLVELAGALALFAFLPADAHEAGSRGFWSLFHSVSAFCNAGFALQPDGMQALRGAWGVNLVLIALIFVGGLGMPVVRDLSAWVRAGGLGRLLHRRRRTPFQRLPRVSVQTRLTLWTTLVLIVGGSVGFLALEFRHALDGLPWDERLLASLFQSVTPRTAGFDTVAVSELRSATHVLLIGLMIVGAGPISTGGGIKTVTIAVLLITLKAMVSGREDVESGGRTIPRRVVRAALAVFVIYMGVAALVIFALALLEPDLPFDGLVFEAFSALSTVGLSTGITPQLSAGSQLVLCVAMFAGRIGPLALALSVFRSRGQRASYRFPDEDLIVG